ncbi:MAG TPA: ATP-dependent sacrificial sulfur transferase LarE [Planctomycetaceae bacterium]|nr:ATP-dependent sacrificial sulfur transferase LarE [Planctomycetaceae bacterium]
MSELGRCVIAFSGGVDSAVVAAAAARSDRLRGGPASIAVTAISPSVPQVQRDIAARVASEIAIEHVCIATAEMSRDDYTKNDTRRCFFCKQTLYGALRKVAADHGGLPIASGTNADDLGDYRPGIEAGRQADVATPLADLRIDKATVRQIATFWELSVAELPAAPCLSSRIAYGVAVTEERLRRIEQAESWLSQRGFSPLRVRLHDGEMARIEVDAGDLGRLVQQPLLSAIRSHFASLGFRAVTVDLAGFRSGSNNQLVNLMLPK